MTNKRSYLCSQCISNANSILVPDSTAVGQGYHGPSASEADEGCFRRHHRGLQSMAGCKHGLFVMFVLEYILAFLQRNTIVSGLSLVKIFFFRTREGTICKFQLCPRRIFFISDRVGLVAACSTGIFVTLRGDSSKYQMVAHPKRSDKILPQDFGRSFSANYDCPARFQHVYSVA